MANQDITINAVFFGIRRRYLAWRWKYAVPIEMNVDGEIGGYGVNKWAPSGTWLIQVSIQNWIILQWPLAALAHDNIFIKFWLAAFFAMYMFTWEEGQHHRYKKYHW